MSYTCCSNESESPFYLYNIKRLPAKKRRSFMKSFQSASYRPISDFASCGCVYDPDRPLIETLLTVIISLLPSWFQIGSRSLSAVLALSTCHQRNRRDQDTTARNKHPTGGWVGGGNGTMRRTEGLKRGGQTDDIDRLTADGQSTWLTNAPIDRCQSQQEPSN